MNRREFVKLAGSASAVALFAPGVSLAQSGSVLNFINTSDLAYLDPITSTAYSTRNHAFMVYDTLFGMDSDFASHPQMLESYETSDDGLTWTLKLREGLFFHDDTPVTAKDCIASIKRWAARHSFGAPLMEATDSLIAEDDVTIRFDLNKPFALLPEALGNPNPPLCVMMPERLAATDPNLAVEEVIGSGPYRFIGEERVPGALVVYRRFERYVPRSEGTPNFISGPKVAHFDEVRWTTMSDVATGTAALQNGEQDWLETVNADIVSLLDSTPDVKVEVLDRMGEMAMLQINHKQPPFNNPAIRRALWGAIDQVALMQSVVGGDPDLARTPIGFFSPDSPMASDAGMQHLNADKTYDQVKQDLIDAGYKGEKVVLIAATENPTYNALAAVMFDVMKKVGLNVELEAMDLATLFARRKNTGPVEEGGWSAFPTSWGGNDWLNPAVHVTLRSIGDSGYAGWADIPEIVELRKQWLEAGSLDEQKVICQKMQEVAFDQVPYYPLGNYQKYTGYRTDRLKNLLQGFPIFWNVEPA